MSLARIPLYRRAVLGYCAHTAAIGAFAFWAPKFLSDRFFADLVKDPSAADAAQQVLGSANFWFGAVTVVAGAIGTIVGGRLADRALRALPPVPAEADHAHPANLRAADAQLRICAIGVALAFPLTAAAFLVPSAWMFFVLAGVAEIGVFLSTAPINAVLLRTAPIFMRASAMAASIFAIHLFGDLGSPTLTGFLIDHLPITIAMMVMPAGFAVAAAVWWPRPREANS